MSDERVTDLVESTTVDFLYGPSGSVPKKITPTNVVKSSFSGLPISIPFIVSGNGNTLALGVVAYFPIDFDCDISQVTLFADQSGSVTIDIWKCTYSQFDSGATHPVVGDSITASSVPAIASATKYQDTVLNGWTKNFSAGDVLAFNVKVAAVNITQVTVSLKATRR